MDVGLSNFLSGGGRFDQQWYNPDARKRVLSMGARICDSPSGYRLYTRLLLERLDLTSTGFDLERGGHV